MEYELALLPRPSSPRFASLPHTCLSHTRRSVGGWLRAESPAARSTSSRIVPDGNAINWIVVPLSLPPVRYLRVRCASPRCIFFAGGCCTALDTRSWFRSGNPRVAGNDQVYKREGRRLSSLSHSLAPPLLCWQPAESVVLAESRGLGLIRWPVMHDRRNAAGRAADRTQLHPNAGFRAARKNL